MTSKEQQKAYNNLCEDLGPSEIDLLDEVLDL